MENVLVSDRSNRTIYISDFLFTQALAYGKKPEVDRKASRIIEYALVEYFEKRGIDMTPYKTMGDSE